MPVDTRNRVLEATHCFGLVIASAMRSSMRQTAARAHSLICLLSMGCKSHFFVRL